MWGTAIIGFGSRHYRYASGREGDVAAVSFSPRKAQTTLYLTGGLEQYEDLLASLGPRPGAAKAACISSGWTRPTHRPCETLLPAHTAAPPRPPEPPAQANPYLAQRCAALAQSVSSRSCRLSSLPPGLRGSGVALTATYCGILKSAMCVPR